MTAKNDSGISSSDTNLDRYYGNLRNYVRMVTGGYSNLLMLDAKGGLGKTHNVRETLSAEREPNEWTHVKGFTTPIELFKTLWKARASGHVLFLDDMAGLASNKKALEMLKAATDTQGDENWVEYRSSKSIDHPTVPGAELPNTFNFRGRIILSFNDTPNSKHFEALMDRGTYYNLTLSYDERLDIIDILANEHDFSNISVTKQQEIADWIRQVTNSSFEVTIRSFEEICSMREFADDTGENWQKMALEIFDMDYEKYRIIEMRENAEMSVEKQVEQFCDEFDRSERHYYNLMSEIKQEREM